MIETANDLQAAIDRFGRFFQCAHDLGLKVNFKKTEALLRLAGHFHSQFQSKHILRTAEGTFLRVPCGNQVALVPLRAQVTYLGVKITYQNLQRATIAHRLASSRTIFQRLRIWLNCNSNIPIDKRFQLWQSTVFAAMTYGIFTTGLVHHGLQTLQTEIMRQLRCIAGNFAQHTDDTHIQFLQKRGWSSPAQLLLRRVEGMIKRYQHRSHTLHSDDIVLRENWDHLHDTRLLLEQAMQVDPTAQALCSALQPDVQHQCLFCDRQFHSVKAWRLHMRVEHGYTLTPFINVHFSRDSQDGMPHCKICDISFQTWQLFQRHVSLHVHAHWTQDSRDELAHQLNNAAANGPSRATSAPSAALDQAPTAPPSTHGPVPHVRSALFDAARATPIGERALRHVSAHNWQGIKDDDEVKQWLCTHCIVCNVYVGS